MTSRRASTLLELLVTLAVMALVAAVVTVALAPTSRALDPRQAVVAEARRSALRNVRAVTIDTAFDGAAASVTAFPDGSVVADTALHVEHPLTAEMRR